MKFYAWVSKLNEWIAKIGSWFALFLTIVVSYDVTMRYFFRAPTIWAFEISWMLYAAHFLCGLAYTLHLGGHVRVDVIYDKFSPRVKSILDTAFLLFCLLPVCFVIVIYGVPYALRSWIIREGSHFTIWAPASYPIKTLIPLMFFLLGLQGVLEVLRQLKIIKGEK